MRRFYPLVFVMMLTLFTAMAIAQAAAPAPAPNAPDTAKQPSTSQPYDPVLDVPPLPKGKATLVGGTVDKIDGIRNKLNVKIFGGGKMSVNFDERTHIYRDGVETTFQGIHKGDRVYVDTLADGRQILAKNIRILSKTGPADARGQVLGYDKDGGMTVRDNLTSQAVNFSVTPQTRITRDGQPVARGEVQPGSLVSVVFAPGNKANRGVAQEIKVLAVPGQSVTFAGKVTNVDLRQGLLAVENRSDNKTYDIAMGSGSVPSNLQVGSDVTISAVFDGRSYRASSINVERGGGQ